jgi:hypothetical protein
VLNWVTGVREVFSLFRDFIMTNRTDSAQSGADLPGAGVIQVAYEKLFGGGRGVARFSGSGLRYVKLEAGAILVEQDPKKKSKWAQLANSGHNVAWVIRDGKYLARVIDGEVLMLKRRG